MSKSVNNEKPLAPADTEAKGDKAKQTSEFPKRDDTWEEKICPFPLTPYHCPTVDEIDTSGRSFDSKHMTYLGLTFDDLNDLGLRPNPSSECRLLIDKGWLENASNRVLAAICFFKWTGKEYEQISLYEDHEDMKYLILGHIVEFEAHTRTTVLQLLRKEIAACKAELRGSSGEITEDRRADLKIRIAELIERYNEAEREGTLKDEVDG